MKSPQPRESVSFSIPGTPPSVNHYKMRTRRGVTFVSNEARAFKEAVIIFSRRAHDGTMTGKRFSVSIAIYLGKRGKGDVDNFAKLVLDGITAARLIPSDDKVHELLICKYRDRENPRTEVTVETWWQK